MKNNTTNANKQKISGRLIFAALITVFLITGVIAAYNLISTEVSNTAARNEYAELRQWSPARQPSSPGNSSQTDPQGSEEEPDTPESNPILIPDLSVFNPDYIGWIRIDGTEIDYPVVQGTDNIKYLTTTFMGESNPAGTIFMDHACSNGFKGFALLHGHNLRNGSMFAGLHKFRDTEFLETYNEIQVFTLEGDALVFSIFDVKLVTESDAIYDLPVEGQEAFTRYFREYGLLGQSIRDRSGILVLSTCTTGPRNERLLVLAALRQN